MALVDKIVGGGATILNFSSVTRTNAREISIDLSPYLENYQDLSIDNIFYQLHNVINPASLSSSVTHVLSATYDNTTGILTIKSNKTSGTVFSGTETNNGCTIIIVDGDITTVDASA